MADSIVDETLATIAQRFPTSNEPGGVSAPGELPSPVSTDSGGGESAAVVTATNSGWVQQIGVGALAESLPEGVTISLDVAVGSYVSRGQVLATVSPVPAIDDEMMRQLRRSYSIGDTRTLQSDVAYGILQLEDIALRALSPGINDPNTAISIISQMGTVLIDLLGRELEPQVAELHGRTVRRPVEPRHADYVRAALDKMRRAARHEPAVLLAMLRMLATVRDELIRRRTVQDDAMAAIAQQAALVVAEAAHCEALAVDRDDVTILAAELGLVDEAAAVSDE